MRNILWTFCAYFRIQSSCLSKTSWTRIWYIRFFITPRAVFCILIPRCPLINRFVSIAFIYVLCITYTSYISNLNVLKCYFYRVWASLNIHSIPDHYVSAASVLSVLLSWIFPPRSATINWGSQKTPLSVHKSCRFISHLLKMQRSYEKSQLNRVLSLIDIC